MSTLMSSHVIPTLLPINTGCYDALRPYLTSGFDMCLCGMLFVNQEANTGLVVSTLCNRSRGLGMTHLHCMHPVLFQVWSVAFLQGWPSPVCSRSLSVHRRRSNLSGV